MVITKGERCSLCVVVDFNARFIFTSNNVAKRIVERNLTRRTACNSLVTTINVLTTSNYVAYWYRGVDYIIYSKCT